ncbi:MAG: sodium:solute symporter family transporter [Bacillota bacterium]
MQGGAWMIVSTILYTVAMMVLSYYVGKRLTRNEMEFMIGGREFSASMTAIGNTSILISGGYLPGIVMYGYLFGVGGMWFYIGWGTGALVALLCWAVFWRTTGAFTPTEWFEYRYGKSGRMAITLVILTASLAIIGWQYVGSGAIIGGALGVSPQMGMIIVGVVVTLYVVLGGVWAATITDIVQWSWVVITTFIALPVYLMFRYGLPDPSKLPAGFLNVPFGTIPVVKFVVPSALTFLLQHQSLLNQSPYWTRAAGGRDAKAVAVGWLWTVIITYLCGILGAWVGVYTRMLVPNLNNAALALGSLMQVIPVPLASLVMCGLIAATMSTCDIYLVSGINQLVRDVAQYFLKINDTARLLNWARWGTFIYGILAVVFAITWTRGLSLLFAFGTAIGAPLFVFYLDSWLLKVGNATGALATVVMSLGTVLYWEILTQNYKQVHTLWVVFPVAIATLVIASALSGGRKKPEVKGELSDVGIAILTAIQLGYNTAVKITNILDPFMREKRIQAGYIHAELDKLEAMGYIERESPRLTRQLFFKLTEKGSAEADKHVAEEDRLAMEKYGLDFKSLKVLHAVAQQTTPVSIDVLAQTLRLYSLQLVAIIEKLNERKLATSCGFVRLMLKCTESGRSLASSASQDTLLNLQA